MQRIEFCRFTDYRYAECRHTECRGAKTKVAAKIVTKRDRKRKREKKCGQKDFSSPTEMFLHHKKCITWSRLHLGNDTFDKGLSLMTVERKSLICQENLEFK
jgi:hypothetical protein